MPRRLTESERKEYERWPEFRIEIPSVVTLTCPACQAEHKCDVTVDCNPDWREEWGSTQAIATSEIDTWRCEECGTHGCRECVSFPHPDDVDLKICGKCKNGG